VRDLQIRLCVATLAERIFSWVCSHWRRTSWEKRYRLSFTDPCNIRTVSLYLYFTIEGFIEIFPLSAYINSKRHFYLSDKFSQVLGTSPGIAGKSGKESPRGSGATVRTARGGWQKDVSFALEEKLLARYEGAKVTADKPRAYTFGNRVWAFPMNLCEAHLILWPFLSNSFEEFFDRPRWIISILTYFENFFDKWQYNGIAIAIIESILCSFISHIIREKKLIKRTFLIF